MKKFLHFVLFFSLTNVWAVPSDSIQLIGTLKTEGGELIPIKLNMAVQSGGKVTGVSTTNFLNQDKTESRIEGTIDFERQILEFSEIENVSTSSDADKNEFCYIRVKNLHWRLNQEKSIFNGQFKGYFPDSTLCASGEIYLVNIHVLRKMVSENKRLRDIRDSLKLYHQAISNPSVKDRTDTARIDPGTPLLHGAIVPLPWHSNQVKLHVWDKHEEDNDRIAIYVNDSLVHHSVVVTAQKRTFQFDFKDDKVFTIKIVAENEGEQPPNTVNAHLIDTGKVHPLLTTLKKDEFVEVRLIKPKG